MNKWLYFALTGGGTFGAFCLLDYLFEGKINLPLALGAGLVLGGINFVLYQCRAKAAQRDEPR